MKQARPIPAHAVILDIEGTVGSVRYVKDVLFPYARQRYSAWFQSLSPADRDRLRADIAASEGAADPVAQLEAWTDADVKHPVLKDVQARIWHTGFQTGELRGSVYPDVEPALRRWRAAGASIYIYSSGSTAAQRDWFGHSERGDLTPLLDGFFDLGVGGKKEPDSYRAIAAAIGVAPEQAVFFSDIAAELTAAERAGMRAVHVVRDGAGPPGGARLVVSEFTDVTVAPTGSSPDFSEVPIHD